MKRWKTRILLVLCLQMLTVTAVQAQNPAVSPASGAPTSTIRRMGSTSARTDASTSRRGTTPTWL